MAFTQSDLDTLDKAYRGGAAETTFSDGRHVRWRSVKEYQELRAMMASDVALATNVTPAVRVIRFYMDDDFAS